MKRKFFRKIKYLDKRMLAGGIVFFGVVIIMLGYYFFSCRFEQMMEILIAIIAALAVFQQTKKSADTAKAGFVLDLQQDYVSGDSFTNLFEYCWDNYNEKITNEDLYEYLQNQKVVLLNYFTFFESVYLMKEQGVIKMSYLDELFGRRFFVVVNNKMVQKIDLCPNYRYYLNVLYLYSDWYEYRKKLNKCYNDEKISGKIFADKDSVSFALHKTEAYKKVFGQEM